MITGEEKFILLQMNDIHEGIAGIVAGKIKENYNRPVIILTHSGEGFLKGTGRSIPSIDIYRLLKNHDNLFERFGGHKSACGLLMAESNFDTLKSALDNEMKALLEKNPDLFEEEIAWDAEITPGDITLEFAKVLDKMEPFGQDNPRPVFLMKNIRVTGTRFMGADKTHARLNILSQDGCRGECVLFKRAQELKELLLGEQDIDITGTITVKSWKGCESSQFIVEEILPCR